MSDPEDPDLVPYAPRELIYELLRKPPEHGEPVDTANGDEPGAMLGPRIDWSTAWKRERADHDYLIEPILPRGRAIVLFAETKAGKSLLSLECAAAAATGRSVLDQPASPPVTVLYADYEMTEDDVLERLADMGYSEADDLTRLHYHFPRLPLDTKDGGKALAEYAVHIGAELVVIDTVNASTEGDENLSDTFSNLNRYTIRPLKRAGITVLRLDHQGKDPAKGQRGSSAKNEDVDIVWHLTVGDGGTLTLVARYRRIPWVPEKVALIRTESPLTHLTGGTGWVHGTLECANLLDSLGADIDITVRAAQKLLQNAGNGTKQAVVRDAVKYRREGVREPTDFVSRSSGYTPDTPPPDTEPDTEPPEEF